MHLIETACAGPPYGGLGARLVAAAGCVRRGRVAADIGCDHGKLAVYLARRGIAPRVIAVDSRPQPLARARELVARTGCEAAVDCRLGNGLEPLAPCEAEDIVVAGLSGQTMIEIFEGCAWLRTKGIHLVLVPSSLHTRLRRWLCQNGFLLQAERPVLESGRSYTVISALYTGEATQPTALFCQLGLVPQSGGEAARAYIEKRLAHLRKKGAAAKTPPEKQQHQQLMEEVMACLR